MGLFCAPTTHTSFENHLIAVNFGKKIMNFSKKNLIAVNNLILIIYLLFIFYITTRKVLLGVLKFQTNLTRKRVLRFQTVLTDKWQRIWQYVALWSFDLGLSDCIKIASLKLRNGENESEIGNYRNPKREREERDRN